MSQSDRVDVSAERLSEALRELSLHQTELQLQNEELRNIQAELIASRQAYLDLYNLAPVGYCSLNSLGEVVRANHRTAELFEARLSDLLSKPFTELVLDEDQDIFYHFRNDLIRSSGIQQSCELRMLKKNGGVFCGHLSAVSVSTPEGGVQSLATISDITRIKNAEIELVQSAKLASLGLMSMGIAHEINNPLAVIVGSLELLRIRPDDLSEYNTRIGWIQKSTDRIAKIVKGISKFSRNSEQICFGPQVLSKILREAISISEGKAKQERTSITCIIESNSLIHCDEIAVEQVILNLVGNSIDAVKESTERWIKIDLFDDDESVVLRVTDSGAGIPTEISTKLFDPFFTTKDVGRGTGLGLFITKGILDDHGASIVVRGDLPNTCFEVRFPRVTVEPGARPETC